MTDRGLIVFADGRINEADADGHFVTRHADGVFTELADAGYPLYVDTENPGGVACFDISVDSASAVVTAYTAEGEGTPERAMGRAPARLAEWLRATEAV